SPPSVRSAVAGRSKPQSSSTSARETGAPSGSRTRSDSRPRDVPSTRSKVFPAAALATCVRREGNEPGSVAHRKRSNSIASAAYRPAASATATICAPLPAPEPFQIVAPAAGEPSGKRTVPVVERGGTEEKEGSLAPVSSTCVRALGSDGGSASLVELDV